MRIQIGMLLFAQMKETSAYYFCHKNYYKKVSTSAYCRGEVYCTLRHKMSDSQDILANIE